MGRRPAPLEPRKVTVNGGEVRWEVRIPAELRKQEGKTRRYFLKQAEALGYCNRLRTDARRFSDKAHGLTDAQKIEAQACFEQLAQWPGATLTAAVAHYGAHLNQQARSVTLAELGERIVADKRALGGRGAGKRTLDEISERWGRFSRDLGADRLASEISPEMVNDWIVGLPVALPTKRGYRRVLHGVFAFAADRVRRWVQTNPVSDVELPTSKRERVSLFTPEETAAFLGAAVPEMRPFLAICAFAGARPDQAKAIQWEQVHLDRHEIEIPAGTDKVDRERIVPIQPNLAAWLEQVPAALRCGPLFYSRAFFRHAVRDSNLGPWEQDVLRHSYCSYRLKITGSFGTVADEAGNSEKIIRERYYRSVSPAVAAAYFALLPPTLPAGYQHLRKLTRWNMAAARAARVLPSPQDK